VENEYEAKACPACMGLHLFNRKTGRILSSVNEQVDKFTDVDSRYPANRNFRFWHETDMPQWSLHVRYQGCSRSRISGREISF